MAHQKWGNGTCDCDHSIQLSNYNGGTTEANVIAILPD